MLMPAQFGDTQLGNKKQTIFKKVIIIDQIGSDWILKDQFQRKNSKQICQLILFQSFILMNIQQNFYIVDIDINLGFEVNSKQNSIEFRFCDYQQLEAEEFIFCSQKIGNIWQNQLKFRLPGLRFNKKYKIIQTEGKGINSIVYKIQRLCDCQIFAAKVVSLTFSLMLEIKMLSQLDHPNLIHFKQFYIVNNSALIILDFQDGGTLLNHIKGEKNLTMKQKSKIFMDVLNGLQFLRIKQIVHRDLKPQNIFYSKKDKNYKIGDFGLALKQNTLYSNVVGTAGYIPPQLFKDDENNKIASIKSDIYSAGLIFYQVITKQRYFQGENHNQILKNNLKGKGNKYFKHQSISQIQKKLLNMMIRSSPSKRKDSLQILKSQVMNTFIRLYNFTIKKSPENFPKDFSKTKTQQNDPNSFGFMGTFKYYLGIKNNLQI